MPWNFNSTSYSNLGSSEGIACCRRRKSAIGSPEFFLWRDRNPRILRENHAQIASECGIRPQSARGTELATTNSVKPIVVILLAATISVLLASASFADAQAWIPTTAPTANAHGIACSADGHRVVAAVGGTIEPGYSRTPVYTSA